MDHWIVHLELMGALVLIGLAERPGGCEEGSRGLGRSLLQVQARGRLPALTGPIWLDAGGREQALLIWVVA